MPDYARVKRRAEKVLSDSGISIPVDPETISEDLGVDVVYVAFKGDADKEIAGFYDFDEKRIYVNKTISASDKIFTIAHELGHHILHQEYAKSERYEVLLRVKDYGEHPVAKEEKEADAFAVSLLIPDHHLKRYEKLASDSQLAALFAVSVDVIHQKRKLA